MKVVYVAGKLTGKDNFEISRNVHAAEYVAMEVVKLGAVPLIPHANTGFTFFGTATEEFWYEGTLELLRRCDAVILVSNWASSKGARMEVDEAFRRKIPVFERVAQLGAWLAGDPKAVQLTLGDLEWLGRHGLLPKRGTRKMWQTDRLDDSTRYCPCGGQITWEEGRGRVLPVEHRPRPDREVRRDSDVDRRLDAWMAEHRSHVDTDVIEGIK